MNTFHLLSFEIRLDMNHGILGEELTELELGVIKRTVTGDLARDIERLAGVNQSLLSIDHEFFVAEVAADDDIATGDEGVDGCMVKGVALDGRDFGRRGY